LNIYSSTGSEQFNKFLDNTLQALGSEIQQAVGEPFLALILAGGYGRGEGACVLKDGKEAPYNDFDLFLVCRDRTALSNKVLQITKKYEELLGIEVDIGKPLTLDMIKGLPHQLMWQDLLESHKVIVGTPGFSLIMPLLTWAIAYHRLRHYDCCSIEVRGSCKRSSTAMQACRMQSMLFLIRISSEETGRSALWQ